MYQSPGNYNFLHMKAKMVIICLIFNLFSCISFVSEERLSEILISDAVFGPENTAGAFAEYSRGKDITIFGETHYVQQHQEFIVEYLKTAYENGTRLFMNEMPNAYGYVIDEYIQGNIDEIPTALRFMENYIIEGLKEFNLQLDKNERIHYSGIDMNHWPEALSKTVKILSGLTELSYEILKICKIDFFDENYPAQIKKNLNFIINEKEDLSESMGSRWYGIFHDLFENELYSIEYRNTGSDEFREKCMYEMINRAAANTDHAVLNVGMYHAQKQHALGAPVKRLAGMLEESGYDIFCAAFFPAQGDFKDRFFDTDTYHIDLLKKKGKDLCAMLVNLAENRMSFLPLKAPLFSEQKIKMSFGRADTAAYPARIFDALVTYPRGRIPDSMLEFEL